MKTVKLGDVCEFDSGFAFSSKNFSRDEGIGLIRIRDIKNGYSTETNYTGEYDEKYLVYAGDYLIGMDGEFKCYEWRGEPALLNQRVCRLREDSDFLDPRYFFYGINKHLKEIEDVTVFTTVKHISVKQIRNIDFVLPSLEEQRRVVARLDAAFERISAAEVLMRRNLDNVAALQKSILHKYLSVDDSTHTHTD
ncbi:MAG: restriction endonuclease subunit S [Candidatus Saccharimonadales bacterium]